jgi:hypothetical protein
MEGVFANFFHLIDTTWVTQKHLIQAFPNLTNFLNFWFDFKNDKVIPLVSPKHIGPIF